MSAAKMRAEGPGDARGDHGDGSQPAIADLTLRKGPKFHSASRR